LPLASAPLPTQRFFKFKSKIKKNEEKIRISYCPKTFERGGSA
jgi:hypothetical protein